MMMSVAVVAACSRPVVVGLLSSSLPVRLSDSD